MTHTPGPWSVCDDGDPGEPMLKVVGRTARHEIALCCTGAIPQNEETANARLIAEAPNMLDALQVAAPVLALVKDLPMRAEEKTLVTGALEIVRAAIAKATVGVQ